MNYDQTTACVLKVSLFHFVDIVVVRLKNLAMLIAFVSYHSYACYSVKENSFHNFQTSW